MSSFVNKSGKKVAPKAPRRRAPAKSSSIASTPQPEAEPIQDAHVTQPTSQVTQPEVDIANPTQEAEQRSQADLSHIHILPTHSLDTQPHSESDIARLSEIPFPNPEAEVEGVQPASPTVDPLEVDGTISQATSQASLAPQAADVTPRPAQPLAETPPLALSTPRQSTVGNLLPNAPSVGASPKSTQAPKPSNAVPLTQTPQPPIIPSPRATRPSVAANSESNTPHQSQFQVEVPIKSNSRASSKSARLSRASSSATSATLEDQWHITTQADLTARSSKGQGKLPANQELAPSSVASRRLANAAKRKRKRLEQESISRRLTGLATASAIDQVVRESIEERGVNVDRLSSERRRASEYDEAEDEEQSHRKRTRAAREGTPEENERVEIVPGMTRMNDLTRDMRVGRKSEREKMMRTINWREVKERRRVDEFRQATHRGRPDADSSSLAAEREEGNEDLDEEELIERALERNRKRGQANLRIRLVGGEHVIDEQSQFVDRHAMVDEEMELLEEVEEDDLTKKFNVQTYVTWRRKDPAERILTHEKWTIDATDRFYDCLYQFGTDFMTISKMFPGRTRRHVKSKFVKEERSDPNRIKEALLGHLTRQRHGEGWDLKAFIDASGMKESDFKDPKVFMEELRVAREAMEKQIEEAKKETAELEHQMRQAGWAPDDEDVDMDGEPLTPDQVLRRATEQAARMKREKQAAKRARKHGPPTGGQEEEIVETIEGEDG
jgi:transcription factor TFIIIB component B''